jgi:DNA-binding NarL/FixJ family response regulator
MRRKQLAGILRVAGKSGTLSAQVINGLNRDTKGAANVKPSSNESVLVLAADMESASDLQGIALRNAWSVQQPASASAALEEILHRRPAVVLVQVSPAPDEAVRVIRQVRANSLPVFLVAVAVSHDDEIERAVRIAGVDSYLDETADAALIENTVAGLLERRERANLRARVRRTAPRRRYQHSLSPFLLLADMGGGIEFPTAHFLKTRARTRSQHSRAELRTRFTTSFSGREPKRGRAKA